MKRTLVTTIPLGAAAVGALGGPAPARTDNGRPATYLLAGLDTDSSSRTFTRHV